MCIFGMAASKHCIAGLLQRVMVVLQAYVHRMAKCLLEISDDSESKFLLELQRYSLEITAVFVCCWISNAHKMAAAVTESLSTQHDCICQEGLPNDQYQDLLVNHSVF